MCICFLFNYFQQFPQAKVYLKLSEKIHLFLHDPNSVNVLQLLRSADDVHDETLIEIVLASMLPEVKLLKLYYFGYLQLT